MRRATASFVIAVGVSLTTAAQQQPRPAFRSGIDLLTVQASVLDKDGRPVRDLQASDFIVTVNGQPRKVVFARFNGTDATGVYARSSGTAPAAPAIAAVAPSGSLVMFVVDRDTIRTGSEKAIFATGMTVLDALSPADAVGLVGLPTGGVAVAYLVGRS